MAEADAPKGKGPNNLDLRGFVNSVMSYTKMDVPTVELFETAVTFDEKHARSAFGASVPVQERLEKRPASVSCFVLIRQAKAATGCTPLIRGWNLLPRRSARLLQRELFIQLCEGLPYRFALDACVGREKLVNGEKEVEPFRTPQEVEAWIKAAGPKFGFKPDFFNADDQGIAVSLRRPHDQVALCVDRRRAAE